MSDLESAGDTDRSSVGDATPEPSPPIDLDEIERDLRDVETALARLADGTYFPQPGAFVPGTNAPGSSNDPTADTSVEAGLGS